MALHNIEGLEISTGWYARGADQCAYGETEQEALQALVGMLSQVRLRLMMHGRVSDEEWVSRAQLEKYWDEIEAHARAQKALIILDHPSSPIIHIFAY